LANPLLVKGYQNSEPTIKQISVFYMPPKQHLHSRGENGAYGSTSTTNYYYSSSNISCSWVGIFHNFNDPLLLIITRIWVSTTKGDPGGALSRNSRLVTYHLVFDSLICY